MRSLCSPAFYVPGIGMGWRGVVSRENADGWPWRAITKRLTIRTSQPRGARHGGPRPWRGADRPDYCAIAPFPQRKKGSLSPHQLTANPAAALPTDQENVAGM